MSEFLWKDREKKDYGYPFSPRPECLDMLQRPPTVALDIGCGSGGVGYSLRQRYPACALWGCEFDATAAQMARQHFDKVVEQDVETADFGAQGLHEPFDLVCLFDVLEHLVNPWKLLHGLKRNIATDAHILVSLPNASNLPLLYDALRGHWRYMSWGLLDFTHLRFFTDFDARKMFYQTGYRVLDHRRNFHSNSRAIFERHQAATFPTVLALEGMTVEVKSVEDLGRICADQNLYLISPHHDQFRDDAEREMASNHYPNTYTLGG